MLVIIAWEQIQINATILSWNMFCQNLSALCRVQQKRTSQKLCINSQIGFYETRVLIFLKCPELWLFSVGYLYSSILSLHQFYLINVIGKHFNFIIKNKYSEPLTDMAVNAKVVLNGSLTITELRKYYRFLIWRFVPFERSVLVFGVCLYITERSLPCPCEKISSLEYW